MDKDNNIYRMTNEPIEEYLWRLGQEKENGSPLSWQKIAELINSSLAEEDAPVSESSVRKKYKRMRNALGQESIYILEDNEMSEYTKKNYCEMEKRKVILRDERNSIKAMIREEARHDNVMEIMHDAIKRVEPNSVPKMRDDKPSRGSVIAMLGDVHFGMDFSSVYGEYNTDIARFRIMEYATEIVQKAKLNNTTEACYVALMGDMINGNIHDNVRVENKENVIQQVIGVSEIVVSFLQLLSSVFDNVYVYSVGGNHSRTDQDKKRVLKDERMDDFIPWYCKTRFENVDNVEFVDGIDSTLAMIRAYDKNYLVVHGDMDKSPKDSAVKISSLLKEDVYAILSGHNHVSKMDFDDVISIQNGCVCGSGGDFCERHRLHAPASQTFMTIARNGINGVFPVDLSYIDSDYADL